MQSLGHFEREGRDASVQKKPHVGTFRPHLEPLAINHIEWHELLVHVQIRDEALCVHARISKDHTEKSINKQIY